MLKRAAALSEMTHFELAEIRGNSTVTCFQIVSAAENRTDLTGFPNKRQTRWGLNFMLLKRRTIHLLRTSVIKHSFSKDEFLKRKSPDCISNGILTTHA
jgi:hypothetical protein